MDAGLKAKWVKELCSGKYAQGRGILYDSQDEVYCCLGVLHLCAGFKQSDIDGHKYGKSTEIMGDIDNANALADLNDLGVPFEVIAGLIQEAL